MRKGIRLIIRGGSIAAGKGVTKGYADILTDKFADKGLEIVNRSRANENSFDGVETFKDDIAPYYPDILLIHFGIDDAFFPVYRSEFKENLVLMVRAAKNLNKPFIILSTSHTFDDPYEMDAVNIYYRTIREVCIDLDCTMAPVHTCWAGYLYENHLTNIEFTQKDARLPNEKGHMLFADALAITIDRIVQKRSTYILSGP